MKTTKNTAVYLFLIILISFLPAEKTFSRAGFNVYDTTQQYKVPISAQRENILIILDCSLSMEDEINGVKKIDIAKDVINKVLAQIPGNVYVGLRVYGHKRNLFKSILGLDDCQASELLVPINTNNRYNISRALTGLHPVGMTPICYSIDQSINNDFVGLPGKKRIILVSDGMETCNGNPCDFAVNMVKRKINVSIDVIGFDLSSDPSAISSLRCAALVTRGKFYTADNSKQFLKSLQQSFSVSREVEGRILTK